MDDEMFREVATRKGFTLRHQEERLPDPAILVGVELYLDQLMSLDAVCAGTPFPLRRIQLVNPGGHSREEWDRLAPGIGPICTSPLVAIWRNSRWESILLGKSAQDLLSAGLSDFLIG